VIAGGEKLNVMVASVVSAELQPLIMVRKREEMIINPKRIILFIHIFIPLINIL
jgi:hypothetical protein